MRRVRTGFHFERADDLLVVRDVHEPLDRVVPEVDFVCRHGKRRISVVFVEVDPLDPSAIVFAAKRRKRIYNRQPDEYIYVYTVPD